MSENKLRPCPFCGKEPEVAESGECRCNNKSCPMAPNWYLPEDWNPRPIEDALNARIAELEAERRWTPVSERLPEVGKVVDVIDMNDTDSHLNDLYEIAMLVEVRGKKCSGLLGTPAG
jgi:hypothetical protein